jgi:hypothetical protein
MKIAQTEILRFPTNNYFNKLLLLPKIIGLEAAIWIGALLYLAILHTPGETHFTICPINNLGFDFCPGCGLVDVDSFASPLPGAGKTSRGLR